MRTRVAASGAVVFLIVFGCGAFAVSRNVTAAADRGAITGTVTDGSGTALPGVTVTLSGRDQRKTITTAHGEFSFTNLLPGAYEARAELPGFVPVTTATFAASARRVRCEKRSSS